MSESTATEPELSQVPVPKTIQVWVCPHCGSWYGSSAMADLGTAENIRTSMQNSATEDPSEWGKVSGHRDECKICKAREGIVVHRVLVTFISSEAMVEIIEEKTEKMRKEEEKTSGVSARQVPYIAPGPAGSNG